MRTAPLRAAQAGARASVPGGEEDAPGAVYSGELRRTMTGTGVGLVLTAVGAGAAEPSPPKRKLHGAASAPPSPAPPTPPPGAGASLASEHAPAEPAQEGAAHESDPKRRRSGSAERGADCRRPLLDARQAGGDSEAWEDGDPHGDQPLAASERAKQIAAKVAAREQEAAAKQSKPAARLLGIPYGRSKLAPPPEPTPIAARTRTRAARK